MLYNKKERETEDLRLDEIYVKFDAIFHFLCSKLLMHLRIEFEFTDFIHSSGFFERNRNPGNRDEIAVVTDGEPKP